MLLLESFWLWQLLGRLHPMAVHFPIALLVTALFLELLTLGGRRPALRAGIEALVWIGAAGAVTAALLGWLLAEEGYSGSTIDRHRWLGSATALLALATVLLLRRSRRPGAGLGAYRSLLTLSVASVVVTGHLGAGLTHGAGYLAEVLPGAAREAPPLESRALLAQLMVLDEGPGLAEADLDRLNVQVRALFAHRCYRCHSSDQSKGGLVLDSREGVLRGGENGPIIVPGRSGESELVRRISLPPGHEDAMPGEGKEEPLSADEIALIRLWVDRGAHWADEVKTFREAPLALTMPPVPDAPADLTSPVDRFVDVYFERHGLAWNAPVGDAAFLRRVYLDLVGLLPSPEALDAFVRDPHPEKRARLVDELLAREHDYAQHWLSFWNDLLRNDYDGTGYIDGGRRQLTSWLYESLVDNKPYDAMVRELVNPTEASEGFIRGIKWRGAVNASQRVEMQAAQNISQALLGVNLKCASCHNSFVSNLTLEESYAFANVFADTVLQIYRCDKPTGRWAETGFLYPELGEIDGSQPKLVRLQQLSELLTRPENGRLYRTIVNRLWERFMGRGLVEPVDAMDELPWSQELLDWLAADLVANGADLKRTMRAIVLSRAYQLPSVGLENAGAQASGDYVFEGPVRRRLSAEQFADALSQVLTPVYRAVTYDPFDVSVPAEWIWQDTEQDGRQSLPEPGTRYFRHAFTLTRLPAEAELLLAADDAARFYLNGVEVAATPAPGDVVRVTLAGKLRLGTNDVAVEAENHGTIPNPAGVLASLRLVYADGTEQSIASHPGWRVTREPRAAGWTTARFDEAPWEEARSFGSHASNRYWGRLLAFTHDPREHPVPFARAALVSNEPFQRALGRPTRDIVVTSRDDEATLLQALELTNGDFLARALERGADHWIARHGDAPAELVDAVYRRALQRPPTPAEASAALALLGPTPTPEAVQDFLWAVVLLPEFQIL